jgi:hypothetical protein
MPIPLVSVFLNPASWYGSRAFWYRTRVPLFQYQAGICIAPFFIPVLTGFFYYCNLFFPASRKKVYHIRRPLTLLVLRRKMKLKFFLTYSEECPNLGLSNGTTVLNLEQNTDMLGKIRINADIQRTT